MKYLAYRWRARGIVVVSISILLSVLLILLDRTDWAAHINQQGYLHGGEGNKIPIFLRYILPFVKELVLIGVPLLLTLLFLKIFGMLKRSQNR